MKTATLLSILSLSIFANGATIPESPWTTLTATATVPSSVGALTDFTGSFALSVVPFTPAPSANAKRAVTQIGDGQIQKQTSLVQATASVLAQIGDGQVQQQTTASVLAQIGDGQVQQQTTASVLAQIGDGQVQQQTTAAAVQQISDGQIQQHTTAKGQATQISDGQVQATTATQAHQLSDGQVQATGNPNPKAGTSGTISGFIQTCANSNSLVLKLNGGILTDSHGRIGAVVANRQFQFDGPPPQAGTIYAKGWSIVPNSYNKATGEISEWGKLALGTQTTFFKCLSGDFYNLYDESIGVQCSPVEFRVLQVVSC